MPKYDPRFHHRRSVRLRKYDYARPGAYFLTICTLERRCTIATIDTQTTVLTDAGKIVVDLWNDLPRRFAGAVLDVFVVMPNHIHGIIALDGVRSNGALGIVLGTGVTTPQSTLERPAIGDVVRIFKAASSRRIRQTGDDSFAWQRNYYEHAIRDETDLTAIREYIVTNPARWTQDNLHPDSLSNHLKPAAEDHL